MLETLKQTLQKATVVKRGPYTYFQYPLTDGAPGIEPNFLKEICEEIISTTDIDTVDLILTMEAMGIHIATMLSILTNIPFNIIRKKPRYLPHEIILEQQTGYGQGKMYLNGVTSGQKILVVDAVISTGGTLIAVLHALKKIGAIVTDTICVIERGTGKKNVKMETGIDVKTLVTIDVTEEGVKIIRDYYTSK
jgi:adenine phosphoribosyltransferase